MSEFEASSEEATSRAEAILSSCLEADDVDAAIASACSTHPQLAAKIRTVYGRLQDFGLAAAIPTTRPQLEGFDLLEKLGQGGMGIVYRAWQASPGREVAVKVVRPEQLHFAGQRERFAREIEAIARLSHPNIVPVLEVGESRDGVPWFSMEFVRGATLAELLAILRTRGDARREAADLRAALASCLDEGVGDLEDTLSRARLFRGTWIEACLTIIEQIASALEHAHARGVLHRDVKPSNVMVTPDGRAMLLDFGLARMDDVSGLTRSTSEVGSLPYMPPESLRGEAIPNPSLDVYGLGVTLYELLTLQNPFLDPSAEKTRARILEGNAKRPRRIDASIPWDVETVCLTAMAPEAEHRYRGCGDILRDLDSLQRRLPIQAKPPGVLLRLRRWQQRNAALTVGIVTALVLATASAFVLLAGERRARRQSDSYLAESERLRKRSERSLYAAQLALGHTSLNAGNHRVARKIFERCDASQRGWEWRYQRLIAESYEQKWKLHDSSAQISVSPDGKSVATLGRDHTLCILDVESREVRARATFDSTSVSRPAFSPDSSLVVVGEPHSLTVVRAKDATVLRRIPTSQKENDHIAFAADGRSVWSIDTEGDVRRTDVASGAVLKQWSAAPGKRKILIVAPGADALLATTGGKTVQIWDPTGRMLQTMRVAEAGITAITFAKDAEFVIVASHDIRTTASAVETFRVSDGSRVQQYRFSTTPNCIAMRSSGRSFVVGGNSLIGYELESGRQMGRLFGHDSAVHSSVVDRENRIWSVSTVGDVCLWDLDNLAYATTIDGHETSITALAVDPSSRHVVSGDRNGTVQVALAKTRRAIAKQKLHEDRVVGIEILDAEPVAASESASSEAPIDTIATLGRDGVLRISTRDSLQELRKVVFDARPLELAQLDGRLVVLCSDSTLRIVARSGRIERRQLPAAEYTAMCAMAERIAIGSKAGGILVVDATGNASHRIETPSPILDMSFDSRASRVAVISQDKLLRLVDVETSSVVASWDEHVTQPSVVRFAPDDELIFSGSWGTAIRFWDPDYDQGLNYTTIPTMVLTLEPSPDGRFVAAAGVDRRIHLLWATRER